MLSRARTTEFRRISAEIAGNSGLSKTTYPSVLLHRGNFIFRTSGFQYPKTKQGLAATEKQSENETGYLYTGLHCPESKCRFPVERKQVGRVSFKLMQSSQMPEPSHSSKPDMSSDDISAKCQPHSFPPCKQSEYSHCKAFRWPVMANCGRDFLPTRISSSAGHELDGLRNLVTDAPHHRYTSCRNRFAPTFCLTSSLHPAQARSWSPTPCLTPDRESVDTRACRHPRIHGQGAATPRGQGQQNKPQAVTASEAPLTVGL